MRKTKSLKKVLLLSNIICGICISIIVIEQLVMGVLTEKEINKMQNDIAIFNSFLSSIKSFELNTMSYINSWDEAYIERAREDYIDVREILSSNPDIFKQDDNLILFSRSVDQVVEAISTLLNERLYYNLDKEEAFSTIKLISTGFQFLSQSTYSMSSGYMQTLSKDIGRTSSSYEKRGMAEKLILVLFIPTIFSIMFNVISSTIKGFMKIEKAAEKLAEDDWDFEDLPHSIYLEIEITSKAFNKMKKKLKQNMDSIHEQMRLKELLASKAIENEKQRRLIQETQFNLLQAQINPHFLFNTLNMITNNVRLGERNEETADMLVATSRLLRDSIEIKERTIDLYRELKLLDNYITIQKERNRGRIQFIFEIEDNLPEVQIPPFTLQPLVENSILHGLKDSTENGKIYIQAFSDEEGGVIISIGDNGKGIDKKIIETATMGKLDSHGLGNVIKRLRLIYKNNDLILFSKVSDGTMINIHLEKQGKEEENA